MLFRLYSNTMQCYKSRSSSCRLLLPFSQSPYSPSLAGFKTAQPTAPTPECATDETTPTTAQQNEPAHPFKSATSSDQLISSLPPPQTTTHTISDDDSSYTTIETPNSVTWTRITYLASPTLSEEYVHADRLQWDPLQAMKRVVDWRGVGMGYAKGKSERKDGAA